MLKLHIEIKGEIDASGLRRVLNDMDVESFSLFAIDEDGKRVEHGEYADFTWNGKKRLPTGDFTDTINDLLTDDL